MGNSSPPQSSSQQYTQLSIQESQLMAHLIIVEDKLTKEKFMIKHINIANQLEYNKVVKEMQQRKLLSFKKAGKYMVQLKHYQTKQFTEICGKNYKILLYLQHLQVNLKNIYGRKVLKKQSFSQQQIMNILKSVVNCLIILHDNNYKNIFLYKQTIFQCTQSLFKIIDNQLSNKLHPYYQILNNVPTKVGTYLAPELLKQLKRQNNDFYQSPKSDIFTLAVIVIQLCRLETCDSFYDYENRQMRLDDLVKVVEKLDYSLKLKGMLQRMLVEEEEERIGLISFKQMISNDDELYSHQSVSQAVQEEKKTVRLFGSRNRKDHIADSSIMSNNFSKYNSLEKVEVQSKAQTQKQHVLKSNKKIRPLRQYSTKGINFSTKSVNEQPVSRKRPANQPFVFKPIEPFELKQQYKLKNPTFIQVKQTPRSLFMHLNSNTQQQFPYWMKQFQTPVNLLSQNYQAETTPTPIRKFQEFNSNYQSSRNQSRKKEQQQRMVQLRNDIFNNRNYGTHVFKNGARYEGELNGNGQFDGNGILYYPSNEICYSGSWKNNSFHGFGVLNNEHPIEEYRPVDYATFDLSDIKGWRYYEGEFNQDKRDGFGTLHLLNGDKFSGCFKGDEVQGFGTYYMARENRNVNGIWVNSKLKR